MPPVARHDLLETITYAIWRSFRGVPKRGERMEQARCIAQAVVEHLELCRIECRRPERGPGHSTP
jgi:hypothetical protein